MLYELASFLYDNHIFQDLFNVMSGGLTESHAPSAIWKSFKTATQSYIDLLRHEDVTEFMRRSIQIMDEEMCGEKGKGSFSSIFQGSTITQVRKGSSS